MAVRIGAGRFQTGELKESGMADLSRTDLYDLHVSLGAKMVPFAGYEMPVQYPMGVMKEHLHCREAAGLFDVSHMGQVLLHPKSGNIEDAALALESLCPINILGLDEGRQRYALFTNEKGGIIDDLMVAHRGEHLYLVINAACKETDIAHMRAHIGDTCEITEITDRALLALQGPAAEKALKSIAEGVEDMEFMDVVIVASDFGDLWISRSGYTGEDGYEISVPGAFATGLAEALLAMRDVEPIGLGARDSLRLEAGLCLYGNDIEASTSPVEAALEWAVQKVRRNGGDRAGGFPGADRILAEFDNGAQLRRVGLLPDGRAPMRAGTKLYAGAEGGTPIGAVTSGAFGPSIGKPMSMAYVSKALSAVDTTVYGEVRGKRQPATIAKMPFRAATYKR